MGLSLAIGFWVLALLSGYLVGHVASTIKQFFIGG